jgi:Zn-dependent metalloprotease
VAGRVQQRYAQVYDGVPVFGADVTRQVENGKTLSIFGAMYQGIEVDPVPVVTPEEATALFQTLGGLGPSGRPELMVLPGEDDGYTLAYRARIATRNDVRVYFIDATTGETVLSYSEVKRPGR